MLAASLSSGKLLMKPTYVASPRVIRLIVAVAVLVLTACASQTNIPGGRAALECK